MIQQTIKVKIQIKITNQTVNKIKPLNKQHLKNRLILHFYLHYITTQIFINLKIPKFRNSEKYKILKYI